MKDLPVIKARINIRNEPYNIPKALVCITGNLFSWLYAEVIFPKEAIITAIAARRKENDSPLENVKLNNSSLNTNAIPINPRKELSRTFNRIFDLRNKAPLKIFKKIIVENTTATKPLLR